MATHRRSMSGLKVEETEKWGTDKAYERYGKPQYLHGAPPPKDGSFPQFKDEQPTRRNPGEIPVNSWLRGGGEKGWPPGKGKK
jgi:hypothetical protein